MLTPRPAVPPVADAERGPALAPSTTRRHAWADVAKGIAILLVALHHAVLFSLACGIAPDLWRTATQVLQSFRMPLFFLVSGLLAVSSLSRPWRTLVDRKLLQWVWLYLLWSVVTLVLFTVFRNARAGDVDLVEQALLLPVRPETGLWYLFALAVFLPVVRLAQGRVRPEVQVAAAAALSVVFAARWVDLWGGNLDKMGMYFLFFVLGCHAGPLVAATARRATLPLTIAVGLVYTAATLGVTAADLFDVPLVRPLLGLLAVTAGVLIASTVALWRLGAALQRVGQLTLPIYVAHELLLGLVVTPLRPLDDVRYGLLVPPLLAAVAVALALGLHRLAGRVPGLYAPPAALRRLVVPGPRGALPADT